MKRILLAFIALSVIIFLRTNLQAQQPVSRPDDTVCAERYESQELGFEFYYPRTAHVSEEHQADNSPIVVAYPNENAEWEIANVRFLVNGGVCNFDGVNASSAVISGVVENSYFSSDAGAGHDGGTGVRAFDKDGKCLRIEFHRYYSTCAGYEGEEKEHCQKRNGEALKGMDALEQCIDETFKFVTRK